MKSNIKKVNAEFEVVLFDNKKTFTIKKEEEKITFYDELLIEDVINRKFNERSENVTVKENPAKITVLAG